MSEEVRLILTKLKIVAEVEEEGLYLCNRKDGKALLDFINELLKEIENIKSYIKNSDLDKMLWGKELLKIVEREKYDKK